MAEYNPDAWVILRITGEGEEIEKVLGGWYGGLAGANSWRLNSGITSIEANGDLYVIHGWSGSVYRVHKENQRMSMLTASIYETMVRANKETKIEIIDVSESKYLTQRA